MIDAAAWEQANARYLSPALPGVGLRVAKAAGDQCGNALAAAGSELAAIESNMETLPALVLLANALGLSRFEQDVLLLSAAAEFDDSFCALFARAQGD